jgi:hypothetical protein
LSIVRNVMNASSHIQAVRTERDREERQAGGDREGARVDVEPHAGGRRANGDVPLDSPEHSGRLHHHY